MRTITVTEKYKAVNEGRMAKSEFVRQMRQEYPMYISNFDGYDSAVQILKNKQMLFEAKKAEAKAPVYDEKPALTYSLDALDRGIRIELNTMGIDMAAQTVKAEDYKQAENKAKGNLEKNATHYLDLMSGESNKVDKHDKEVEVKRGAGTVDAFNSMKKATLKEGKEVVDPNPPMSEDAKKSMLGKVVGVLNSSHPDITVGIIKDFIRTHYMDLFNGEDIEDEFREYIDNNYEGPSDMRDIEEKQGKDIDMSSKDGYIAFIDNEDILGNYGLEDAEEMARELAMNHHKAGQDQDNFVKSFMAAYKEGGYMTDNMEEKKGKDHDGDGDIDGDDYMAAKDKAIKKAMGKEEQLKEAIKSIIKKTLKVDSMNEAATNRLASLQEDYGDYSGASQIINQLENIVTEVEQFHTKTRDKIQKVYDSMEGIENAEGLKIGVFIGPSIENAFRQDLRPVTKHGYTKDLALPKAKRIDPNLVAQARAQGDIEEIGDAKHTVFTPNI